MTNLLKQTRPAAVLLALLSVPFVMRPAAADPDVDAAITEAGLWIEGAEGGDADTRLVASEMALGLLANHAADDEELAAAAGMIQLATDRERIANSGIDELLESIEQAGANAATPEQWAELQHEINDRLLTLLDGFESGEIDAENAARLLNIAKYAVDAMDNLHEADFPGIEAKQSRLFQILNRLHGIAAGADGLENASASDLMEAFRNTLADMSTRAWGAELINHARAFEIPAAVAAAIIDQNRRGLEAITETIDYLPAAMDGDPEALRAMIEQSQRVEQIITGEAYGRAMWDAMNSRLIDRVPFLRTLASWFGGDPTNPALAAWAGRWETTWGHIVIGADGTVATAEPGFLDRWDCEIVITGATEDTLVGTWEFPTIGEEGTFRWTLVNAVRFEGQRIRSNGVELRWDAWLVAQPQVDPE